MAACLLAWDGGSFVLDQTVSQPVQVDSIARPAGLARKDLALAASTRRIGIYGCYQEPKRAQQATTHFLPSVSPSTNVVEVGFGR